MVNTAGAAACIVPPKTGITTPLSFRSSIRRGVPGADCGHWKFTCESEAYSSGAADPFTETSTPANRVASGKLSDFAPFCDVNPAPVTVTSPPGLHEPAVPLAAAFDKLSDACCGEFDVCGEPDGCARAAAVLASAGVSAGAALLMLSGASEGAARISTATRLNGSVVGAVS